MPPKQPVNRRAPPRRPTDPVVEYTPSHGASAKSCSKRKQTTFDEAVPQTMFPDGDFHPRADAESGLNWNASRATAVTMTVAIAAGKPTRLNWCTPGK